jgi:glutathione S-transferase
MSTLDNVHSYAASVARLGRGLSVTAPASRFPELPLELYEFESCPYCRKVRETLSELDLEYVARPCARGSNHRETVLRLMGHQQFPFLVDPNTGARLFESEDIIDYVHATYRTPRARWRRRVSLLDDLGSTLTSVLRSRGGTTYAPSAIRVQPEHRLVLWGFEASPYCRKVREALCRLNLEYLCRNVAKNGRLRGELVARGGKMQVPFLEDANTKTAIYESDDIVAYLEKTYGGEPQATSSTRT